MDSSPSSSTTHHPLSNDDEPTTKCEEINTKKLVLVGLPLSTLNPLHSLLFFKSTTPTTICNANKPILNLQTLVTESSHVFFRNLHSSIDKCLNFLHLVASNNPLFSKLHSISSEYRKFSQINCGKSTNLNSMSNHSFAAILPGDSVAGMVVSNGILNFLNIYNTLLVVRLVLTWFPSAPPAIVSPLSTLCDPYLNIFRGLIPPLGGTLDFSPILAFLVLNAFTTTASALPAELPSPEASQKSPSQSLPSFHTAMSHLTTSQEKWMRRFDAIRSKGSEH